VATYEDESRFSTERSSVSPSSGIPSKVIRLFFSISQAKTTLPHERREAVINYGCASSSL